MKKLTNVLALEMVLGLEEVKKNEELMEKLLTMKAQFEKKNKTGKDGEKKLTKDQQENERIKMVIIELMEGQEPLQVKELQAMEGLTDYTNQKLSALVRQLVKDGIVERIAGKKATTFKLAE